jgi:hypothetical protein
VYIVVNNNTNPIEALSPDPEYPWNYPTDPDVIMKAAVDATNG